MDGGTTTSLMPGLLPPLLQDSFRAEAVAHLARIREDLDACLEQMPCADLRRVARCHRLVCAYMDLEYPLGATERVVLASSLFNLVLTKDIDIPLQLNLMRSVRRLLNSDERRVIWKNATAFCYETAASGGPPEGPKTTIDPHLVLRIFEELFEAPLMRPREPPRISRSFMSDLRTTFRDTVVYLRPFFDTAAAMELTIRFIGEAETQNGLKAVLALDKAAFFRPYWPPSLQERRSWDDLVPRLLKLWRKRSGTSPWELDCICLLKAATMRTEDFRWDEPSLIRNLAATLRQKFASPIATSGFSSGPYDESRISFFRISDGKDSLSLIYFEGAHLLTFLIGKGPRIKKPEEVLLPPSLLAEPADAIPVAVEGQGEGESPGGYGQGNCGEPMEEEEEKDDRVRLGTLLVCQMFAELSSAQFPSNSGWWSSGLGIILNHLCARLAEFIGYQRGWETYLRDRAARRGVSETAIREVGNCYLQRIPVEDLQATLRVLIPFAHRTMFNHDHTVQTSGLGALRHLSSISPRAVVTPTLPLILSALSGDNLTKSHQVPIVLSLLTRIFKTVFYPEPIIAPYLMDILYSVLPGVDPNDDVKMQATLSFIFEIFAWVPIYTRDTRADALEPRAADVAAAASAAGERKHPVLARDAAGLHDSFGPGFRFADVDGTSTYVAARLGGGIPKENGEHGTGSPTAPADLVEIAQPVVYRDGTRHEHFAIDKESCEQLSELPYKLSEWLPLFLDKIFEVIRASDHEDKQSESAGVSEGLISMVVEIVNFRMDDATSRTVLPMIRKFFVEEAGRLKNAVRHCVYLAKALTCECSEARARSAIDAIVPAMLESTKDGKDAKLVSWMQVQGDAGIRSVEEIFWRLRILCGLFRLAPGSVTIAWLPTLIAVIDAAILYDGPGNSKCGVKHIRKAGAKLIRAVLRSLLQMKVRDVGGNKGPSDGGSPSTTEAGDMRTSLPDWYRPSFVGKEQLIKLLEWYVPGDSEVAAARGLLARYLLQPMAEVTGLLASRVSGSPVTLAPRLAKLLEGHEVPPYLAGIPHGIAAEGPVDNPQGLTRRLQLIEYSVRGCSGSLPDFPGETGDDCILPVGHSALQGTLADIRDVTMVFISLLFDAAAGKTVLGRVLLDKDPTPKAASVGVLGRKLSEDKKFMKRLADVMRILCNDRQYIYNEDDHESFIRLREDLNADHLSEQFFSGAVEANVRFGLNGHEMLSLKEMQESYESRDEVSYLAFNKACLALGNRQRRLAQLVPKALCHIFQPFPSVAQQGESDHDEEAVQADWHYPDPRDKPEIHAQLKEHASNVWGLYARLLGLGAHKSVDVGSRALDGVQVIGDGSGPFHTAMLGRVVPLLDADLWKPLLATTDESLAVLTNEGSTALGTAPDEDGYTSLGKTLVWENLDTVMNFLRLRSSKRKLSRKWFLTAEFLHRLVGAWRLLPMVPKEDEEVLSDYIHDLGRSCVKGYAAPRLRRRQDKDRLDDLFGRLLQALQGRAVGAMDVEAEGPAVDGREEEAMELSQAAAIQDPQEMQRLKEMQEMLAGQEGSASELVSKAKAGLEALPEERQRILLAAFEQMIIGKDAKIAGAPRQTLRGGFISDLHWRFELLTVWMITLLFDGGKDLRNVPARKAATDLIRAEATRCRELLAGPRVKRLDNAPSCPNPQAFIHRGEGLRSGEAADLLASPEHLRESTDFLLEALETVEEGQLMQRVLLGFLQRVVHLARDRSNSLNEYFRSKSLDFLERKRIRLLLQTIWCDRTSSREQDDEATGSAERSWSTGVRDIIWEALRSSLDAFLPRSTDIITVIMDGFRTRHAHLLNRLLTLDVLRGITAVPVVLEELREFLKTNNSAELLSRYSTASGIFSGVLAMVISCSRAANCGELPFDQKLLKEAWGAVVQFLRTTVPQIPLDQKQDWSSAIFYALENCFMLPSPEDDWTALAYKSPPPSAFEPLIEYVSEEMRSTSLFCSDEDLDKTTSSVALSDDYTTQEKLVSFATVLHHGCAQYTERIHMEGEDMSVHQQEFEIHRRFGIGLTRGGLKAVVHPLQSARNFIGCILAVLSQSLALAQAPRRALFQIRYSAGEEQEVTSAVQQAVAAHRSSEDPAKATADPVEEILAVAAEAAARVVRTQTGIAAALAAIVEAAEDAFSALEGSSAAEADEDTLTEAARLELLDKARQSQQHAREIVSRFALVGSITRKAFATSLDVRDVLVMMLPSMLTAVSDAEPQTRDYAKGSMLYTLMIMRNDEDNPDCVQRSLSILSGRKGIRSPSARIREAAADAVQALVSTNGCGMRNADRQHCILLLSKLCGDARPEVVNHAQLALAAVLDRGGPWLAINVAERCSVALEKRLKIVRRREKRRQATKDEGGKDPDALDAKLRKEIVSLLRMLGAAFRCFSYDLPDFMPPTLALLSRASVTAGVSSWPEAREVVQATVTEFKRTHSDNWEQMQLLFSQEHLDALGGADSSPHYFV